MALRLVRTQSENERVRRLAAEAEAAAAKKAADAAAKETPGNDRTPRNARQPHPPTRNETYA